jgi:hypothetical protein
LARFSIPPHSRQTNPLCTDEHGVNLCTFASQAQLVDRSHQRAHANGSRQGHDQHEH